MKVNETTPRGAAFSRKTGRTTWIAASMLLCAYVVVLVFTHHRQTSNSVLPPGSSGSAAGQGSLAIARLWSALRVSFSAWEVPPSLLPEDTSATFVSVEPIPTQYPPAMADALLAWVRSGHTVVVASSGSESIFQALGLVTRHRKFTLTQIHALTDGTQTTVWRRLALPASTYLSGPGLKNATRAYVSQSDLIVGAQISVGKGRVIVLTVPAAFENRYIDRAQNFQVVWTLLGDHPIIWDEYGHGVYTGGFLRQMFQGGRTYSLAFLAMAAILYVFASFVRFGRPRVHAIDAPRHGAEFLEALAVHLQNPRLHPYLGELLTDAVWRRVTSRMGVSERFSGSQESGVLPWGWLDPIVSRGGHADLRTKYQSFRQVMVEHEPRTKRAFRAFLTATAGLLEEVREDDPVGSTDSALSGDSRRVH